MKVVLYILIVHFNINTRSFVIPFALLDPPFLCHLLPLRASAAPCQGCAVAIKGPYCVPHGEFTCVYISGTSAMYYNKSFSTHWHTRPSCPSNMCVKAFTCTQ